MLNQTKYTSITVIQSSFTEQSVMVDCPDKEDKTAIVQSYTTDRADEIIATYTSQIDRLISLRHPNIQSIIEIFVEGENLHLVTGAVQGKPAVATVPLSEERCEKLLKDILPVLTYLHEQGIVHGNISPETILFKAQNQPILTDFRAIVELKIAAGGDVAIPISQQLAALDLANIPNGKQFDLYSLGVTIIYLLSNRELKYLYNANTQKWQWENYLRPSSGKLRRSIDILLNHHTSAADVLQEFQVQSTIIIDPPSPLPETSPYTPTSTQPIPIPETSTYTFTETTPPTSSTQTNTVFTTPTNIQHPQTGIQSASVDNKLPQTLLICGILGALMLFMGMSIGKNNLNPSSSNNSASPSIDRNSSSAPTSVSSPSSPISSSKPDSSPIELMNNNEASSLISQWLEAKKSIFGSSYIKSAGEDLTTGVAYQRNITDNSGNDRSSVDDLARDGMYWTYGNQQVHGIVDIRSIGSDEVRVISIVSEQRTFHNTRTGATKDSITRRAKSCYEFKKVSDRWKISKTPDLFDSCR
jgi:serine/threonine protein kinase